MFAHLPTVQRTDAVMLIPLRSLHIMGKKDVVREAVLLWKKKMVMKDAAVHVMKCAPSNPKTMCAGHAVPAFRLIAAMEHVSVTRQPAPLTANRRRVPMTENGWKVHPAKADGYAAANRTPAA